MSNFKRTSKFLSLVLRHKPEVIGLSLDGEGWADVDMLLQAAQRHGHPLTRDLLGEVVFTSDKQRFTYSPDGSKIRANQGHSVVVDLGLEPTTPPPVLYHETVAKFLASIEASTPTPARPPLRYRRDSAARRRKARRAGCPTR